MSYNSPLETIGIYNCYTGLPAETIPFFKACGYNTYQRWDLGWTLWPSRHAAYYAEMARDIQRMQEAGFKVFVLLSLNMKQRQAGEPEGYGETYFDPGDEAALRQRLEYATTAIQQLKLADGFTLFAGDPGGHRDATPAHLLDCTAKFLALIAREAPRARININTWGIAAWDRFTSPFDVAFWEKEVLLTRELIGRLDLAACQASLEFPLHNYYRSLALQCYDEAGKQPELFPTAAEVAGFKARGVERLWGWPYFLVDECDDGYRPGAAGIAQSETRYLKQLLDTGRRLGLNGMIANAFEANIPAESLNLYAFARFCTDPAATPERVISEFASFIAEPDSIADLARVIAFIENHSTWQAGLPSKCRLPDFDAGARMTAQAALDTLARISVRAQNTLPLPQPPAAYVERLLARVKMLA